MGLHDETHCGCPRGHPPSPGKGSEDLIPLVPRYNTFVLLLGMVRPTQVDGV